jgi:hypothetical protein
MAPMGAFGYLVDDGYGEREGEGQEAALLRMTSNAWERGTGAIFFPVDVAM